MTEVAKGGEARVGTIEGQQHRPMAWIHAGLGATTTVLAASLTLGILARVIAAMTLSPHVDEPSSVLAAHVVADRGLPILPSGAPYFQGYTLSWLLAPFVWLGFGDIEHLHLMRMVLVIAGAVTIWLSFRLGEVLTGSTAVGAIAAALVAIDPLAVQWSAHVRMYGLLQGLTIGLAWAWIVLLRGDRSARQIAIVVALFWAAVFTHVGAALLGPAMALAALLVCGWSVVRTWRVVIPLTLSGIAPVTLLALNRLFRPEAEPARKAVETPWWSFVGDNLLAPLARLRLPLDDWQSRITAGITLYWLVPMAIVCAATLIGARVLLRRTEASQETRVAVITLLAFYWVPMFAIVIFTVSPKVRYLLHLHLLGYPFLAMLVAMMIRRAARDRHRTGVSLSVGACAVALVAIALSIGGALAWRLDHPVTQPNYNAAMAYVASRHQPGDAVVVTLPPVAWLSVDQETRDDLYFLAGSEGWTRADRYTRVTEDGDRLDYWVGIDSIVSTGSLKSLVEDERDVWVVADSARLRDDWTDESEIRDMIREELYPVHIVEGGAIVYRTKPPETAAASMMEEPAEPSQELVPIPTAW